MVLAPRESHSGGNRLVDTGKRSTTSAQEAFAGVGVGGANSDSLGVEEETGRAVMGAHRVFSCPWIYFGSGPEGSSLGCRFFPEHWHLCRVWGQGNGTIYGVGGGGQSAHTENALSVYSTESKRIDYRCLCGAIG